MEGSRSIFHFMDGSPLTFQTYDSSTDRSRLPLAYLTSALDYRKGKDTVFNVLAGANTNLTGAQKELLGWHFKLGHFHISWIQRLTCSASSLIPFKSTTVPINDLPQCAACRYAKATTLPIATSIEKAIASKRDSLKRGHLRPGASVSTDQFVSSIRGRLPHTAGKEKEKERYSGGTVYVDEASGFIKIVNQVSLRAEETITGKHSFERYARTCGVTIAAYRGDNGIFKSATYKADLTRQNQTIQFSGVGAHHQNGVAERCIRTVSEAARSMLIHAALHWPEHVDTSLWPFAMEYATYIYNRLPKKTVGYSPIEIFSGSKQDDTWVKRMRVFGCPAYVLDPAIQDGKKLPRWRPKSRRGQFLGRSPNHASDIGLVRNLNTGFVSAQFHVVYDDFFTTVTSDRDDEAPDTWKILFETSKEMLVEEDDNPPSLHKSWLEPVELEKRKAEERRQVRFRPQPFISSHSSTDNTTNNGEQVESQNRESLVESELTSNAESVDPSQGISMQNDPTEDVPTLQEYLDAEAPELASNEGGNDSEPNSAGWPRTRQFTGTQRVRNRRIYNDDWELGSLFAGVLSLNEQDLCRYQKTVKQQEMRDLDEQGLLHEMYPLTFAAMLENDTPNFGEAMNGPMAEEFYRAMESEMEMLETSMNPWEVVPRIEAKGSNVLDTTWAFKTKRYPDGRVRKYKARICVRGDQQEHGIDFFDTYAPVVGWNTVRLLLILTATLGLATKQVDYTLAFVQAKLDEKDPPIFIEMPRMFEKPGHILKLKRSLYGMRQSPLNFYLHLKRGLEQRGFTQSNLDPFLFYNNNVICLIYVDDCLFFSRNQEEIDQVIADLKKPKNGNHEKYLLDEEDDVAGFLGIHFKKIEDENGNVTKIELTQVGLIRRILVATGLEDCTKITTPSDTKALGKDENGDPAMERWSYASVVGMLLYLASNSRPDIAFAVHQCARFTHCTKRSHERAVKRIVRYLKGTETNGLIIKPTKSLQMDLYADADFAGLWNAEDANDPICTKSRSGILITIGSVPLLWKSKLQTETALSTMESEYIALSHGMRELVAMRALFDELIVMMKLDDSSTTRLSRVFEDNEACRKLASSSMPKMTPRSKHIAVKYHWFREYLDKLNVEILSIDTKEQLADIFTKGLVQKEFQSKRMMVCGW